MADENPTGRADRVPSIPADDDRKVERAVLSFVLDVQPCTLTLAEVSLALNPGTPEFAEGDACERAVCELVGAQLLHCVGGFVVPTRAAVYFERLGLEA